MTLVRLSLLEADREGERSRLYLSKLSCDLRDTDLAWWDGDRKALFCLAEACPDPAALLGRWLGLAKEMELTAHIVPASFPLQGATLGALLEALA